MLFHRFMKYIIAICIIALCGMSYLVYTAYQSHVEVENLISESASLVDTLENKSSAVNPPVKVGTYSPGDIKIVKETKVTNPKRIYASEMVKQRVQTPDGKIRTIFVPQGHEIKAGTRLPEAVFHRPLPPPSMEGFSRTIKSEDVPVGEDAALYLIKQRYASTYGVSVEEVEKMMEVGQIRVKRVEVSSSVVTDYDYPDPYHSYHPNELERPIGDAASRVSVGVDSFDDTSNPPARSAAPQSRSVQPDVKPTPSSINVEKHKEQLTSPGIEAEVNLGVSVYRSERAQQLIDQYGREEGLRRLREIDPETAKQFEPEQGTTPDRSNPDNDASDDGQVELQK